MFCQLQIEQRKKEEEFRRQQEIHRGKLAAELARQQLQLEMEKVNHAKRVQNAENSHFTQYMSRMRLDKIDTESVRGDSKQASLMTQEIDDDAEAKRQEKKQKLFTEQRVCKQLHFFAIIFVQIRLIPTFRMKQNEYLKKLNQKYNDQIREKQMELNDLQETQRQNAEYEQMLAARKIQNRAQFRQDIGQQIEFKNMEMVS